jgi:hypothetical protein
MRRHFNLLQHTVLLPSLLVLYSTAASAQSVNNLGAGDRPVIADPKLADGEVDFDFTLPSTGTYRVTVNIVQGSAPSRLVRHLSSNSYSASGQVIQGEWDGMDMSGRYVEPGEYRIQITADGPTPSRLNYPIHIVRLGISELEAVSAAPVNNEWQMVYFLKGNGYAYYVTPSMAEYSNLADAGELADLDLNNGLPRPSVALHTATDEPVMNGGEYEEFRFNYPLCYTKNATPAFEVKLGESCTSGNGVAGGVGYPVAGYEMRLVAADTQGVWTSADGIEPGVPVTIGGPALGDGVGREDRDMYWGFRYRKIGGSGQWHEVPGHIQTQHRYYTVHDEANWAVGASGVRYSGPWVEVVDYMHQWAEGLSLDTSTDAGVVKTLIRGFFGQDGTIPTAIEGVVYDTYTYGGDGGASHYYNWSSSTIRLRKLFNGHDLGKYVNCSDVSASTSGMLAMLGVDDMRMFHIGNMNLNAIWGIGTNDYTMNLWGSGHSFSYHHIITRDAGIHVSDSCMWLDEDGDPRHLPGTPGQSHDRPWSGVGGYNDLSCTNNPGTYVDPLPFLN